MIKVNVSDKFKILYEMPTGTSIIIMIGGRGGMKTYEASKFIAFSACIKKKRCVVLRDEKSLIRESILNEVLLRYDTANANGVLASHYDRLDTGIKDKETNEMLVFTKGFRASNNDKTANLKSISNVDIAVIEEAEDVRDEIKFNTFADSIRKQGSVIMLVLNTPDVNHWIIKRYFNLVPVKEGYYDIEPKHIEGLLVIKTSYKDNPHLPQHVVKSYNEYGIEGSHLYNLEYYYSAIMGYSSSGMRGQIFADWQQIEAKDYPHDNEIITWGIDFGYTNDPTAIVKCAIRKNNIYIHECAYETGMSAEQIKTALKTNGYSDEGGQMIYIEHDEDKSREMAIMGIPHLKARKGPGSKNAGIAKLKEFNIFYTNSSKNLSKEVSRYAWLIVDGKATNVPIDNYDHLLDATRYAIYTHFFRGGLR